MVHTILICSFALLFTMYLSWEFKATVNYTKYINYLYFAAASTIFAYKLSAFMGAKAGNFLYHALGGGTASVFVFFYIVHNFSYKPTWRLELLSLFAFTAALGVLNELAEYALEFIHFSTFSYDTHDTWRDFMANTTGMLFGWFIVRTVKILAKNRGK